MDPKALGSPAGSCSNVKSGNFPYLRVPQCEIKALGIGTIAASIVCGDELVTASLSRV